MAAMNRRFFFGSLVGLGTATAVQVDAERQPEPIREGDVLVIEAPGHVTRFWIDKIGAYLRQELPGVKVVVLESGMKAKLLRPEAAKELED